MNYLDEKITYKKVGGKLYQIITREVILDSVDEEIAQLENKNTEQTTKINQLKELKQ